MITRILFVSGLFLMGSQLFAADSNEKVESNPVSEEAAALDVLEMDLDSGDFEMLSSCYHRHCRSRRIYCTACNAGGFTFSASSRDDRKAARRAYRRCQRWSSHPWTCRVVSCIPR